MSAESERKEYLREWRQGLWEQIRQKERAIWQFISFYAAGVVLLFGYIKTSDESGRFELTDSTAIVIAIVNLFITLWGVMIVLDANFWLSRNLIFVGNTEKELLDKKDFGKLIPAYYTELPNYAYEKSYTTHLFVLLTSNLFTIFLLGSVAISGRVLLNTDLVLASLYTVGFSAGLLSVFVKDRTLISEFYNVRRDAPGKNMGGRRKEGKGIGEILVSSPITVWGGFVAGLGGSTLLLLGSRYSPWIDLQQADTQTLISVVIPFFAIATLLFTAVFRVFKPKRPKLLEFYKAILGAYFGLSIFILFASLLVWLSIAVVVLYP